VWYSWVDLETLALGSLVEMRLIFIADTVPSSFDRSQFDGFGACDLQVNQRIRVRIMYSQRDIDCTSTSVSNLV
jgi:hypothetical protein